MISYRHLQPADFPLLGRWLTQPHVARWWNHETSPEAVERDFGPTARGEEPNEDLLVHVDGEPVALVQRSWLRDDPGYLAELAAIAPVPDDALTIDYLIGDPAQTGRGLGPEIIRFVTERTWHEHPAARAIVVAVHADNRPSWRALERAGFVRAGTGEMTPDNPIDSRSHHVYHLNRPADQNEGSSWSSGIGGGWRRARVAGWSPQDPQVEAGAVIVGIRIIAPVGLLLGRVWFGQIRADRFPAGRVRPAQR